MVQLFLSVVSNIILDFLSDWNDRKHNSKFVALCQKTSLYKRYDLYEDASLACLFFCTGSKKKADMHFNMKCFVQRDL